MPRSPGSPAPETCHGRSIGADHVIDYSTDDFTGPEERYDLILDNVCNRSLSELRRALTPTGMLIPNGGNFGNRWFSSAGRLISAAIVFRFGKQRLGRFLVSMNSADLLVLKDLINSGKIRPVLQRTYPLTKTAQAIDYVGQGHVQGKVAISM